MRERDDTQTSNRNLTTRRGAQASIFSDATAQASPTLGFPWQPFYSVPQPFQQQDRPDATAVGYRIRVKRGHSDILLFEVLLLS